MTDPEKYAEEYDPEKYAAKIPGKWIAVLAVGAVVYFWLSALGAQREQEQPSDWRTESGCESASESIRCMEAWETDRRKRALAEQLHREGFFDER